MKRFTKVIKLAAGALLIILSQFLFIFKTQAADAPSLRVVYNALGGSMAPHWFRKSWVFSPNMACSTT
ncbi:MAG: hypothetical protein ACREQV_17470 [Candidatus Binatia bacterium]